MHNDIMHKTTPLLKKFEKWRKKVHFAEMHKNIGISCKIIRLDVVEENLETNFDTKSDFSKKVNFVSKFVLKFFFQKMFGNIYMSSKFVTRLLWM